MPLEIVSPDAAAAANSSSSHEQRAKPIIIGLVNNMPDAALEATEAQFFHLLQSAADTTLNVQLRFSYLPQVARSVAAQTHIERSYWPLQHMQQQGLDALIVTGAEPLAPTLAQEPYWESFTQLLDWADTNTRSSIWSCLAAHAAVAHLSGIARRRLLQKCCGVYEHELAPSQALLEGLTAPLCIPHSRWNELPLEALRAAGYTLLSTSASSGADMFLRHHRSLQLFLQGHPEYEDTTLLKEYRRDVGRFLSAQQAHYPSVPDGYFSPEAIALLEAFRDQAVRERRSELLAHFPFTQVAACLHNSWRAAAVRIYGNWLRYIARARQPVTAGASPGMI